MRKNGKSAIWILIPPESAAMQTRTLPSSGEPGSVEILVRFGLCHQLQDADRGVGNEVEKRGRKQKRTGGEEPGIHCGKTKTLRDLRPSVGEGFLAHYIKAGLAMTVRTAEKYANSLRGDSWKGRMFTSQALVLPGHLQTCLFVQNPQRPSTPLKWSKDFIFANSDITC